MTDKTTIDDLLTHAETMKNALRRRLRQVDKAVATAVNMRERRNLWHEDLVASAADDVGIDSYDFKMTCLDYARGE